MNARKLKAPDMRNSQLGNLEALQSAAAGIKPGPQDSFHHLRLVSSRPDPALTFLKRSKFTQALIDIACLAFGLFLSFVLGLAIAGSIFALFFIR